MPKYLRYIIAIAGLLALISAGLAGCGQSSPTTTTATYKNASVDEAYQLIQDNASNPDFIIIDVRTPGEYADGHIAGAVLVDLNSGSFDTDIIKQDKSKTYLVYCHSGNRSATASGKMARFGFTDVTNMTGGITVDKRRLPDGPIEPVPSFGVRSLTWSAPDVMIPQGVQHYVQFPPPRLTHGIT